MAAFSVNGQLIPAAATSSTTPNSIYPRRKFRAPSSSRLPRISSPSPRVPSIKCSSSLPSRDTEPSPKDFFLKSLAKPLAVASVSSAASFFLFRISNLPSLLSGGGGGGGDGNFGGFGGGGGGGDGDDGGFWGKLFSPAPAVADEEQSPDWDSHGLPGNIVVQLNKLSGFKKYKVSDIVFFDRRRQTSIGTEDSFFEMVSIRPGGVYTKAQLQKELETLATCGMFEKVDLEGKTKPDGTLGVTISFAESTWQSADRFRCINVGLMVQSKPIEMDTDMTDKEKLESEKEDEVSKEWTKLVLDIAYDVEDVLDCYNLKTVQRSQRRGLMRLIKIFGETMDSYRITDDIGSLKRRISDVTRKRETYGIGNFNEPPQGGGNISSLKVSELRRARPVDQEELVVGFDDDAKILLAKLLDDDDDDVVEKMYIISILGMGALGKTAIARKLYNSGDVKRRFEYRAWTYVSQKGGVRRLP
ncbi:hypothetical protein F2Q70_00012382 [Brassica cretica]|uniref:NB-ARC domain-containing protein n=1 Tax=Brassica cretica TaxID=69181 RepID=A0A8S9M3I9_BRACR|nr:hypothetical protein F2Q70_00012382 [Brassica cretica]